MIGAVKFLVFVIALVVVLSINIKDRPVFSHIYNAISPATEPAQKSVERFFSNSFSNTSKVSKQIFDNSVPKIKDQISSKQSAPAGKGKPQEQIKREEREELDDLIKDHSKR